MASEPLFYPSIIHKSSLGALSKNKERDAVQSPPTQFSAVGSPAGHLCQVFNCFGSGALILQLMALTLLEKARKPWQGIPERKTVLALLLSICCPWALHAHMSTLDRTYAAAQAPHTEIRKNLPSAQVTQLSSAQRSAFQ